MAWQVGDEPLLLARHGPVWIARNPRHALQSACHDGARLVIADDGMQNPLLKKSFHILVVNGATGFGNGFLLPAGPLRETPARAVKRAAVVVVIAPENSRANEDSRGEKNAHVWHLTVCHLYRRWRVCVFGIKHRWCVPS